MTKISFASTGLFKKSKAQMFAFLLVALVLTAHTVSATEALGFDDTKTEVEQKVRMHDQRPILLNAL